MRWFAVCGVASLRAELRCLGRSERGRCLSEPCRRSRSSQPQQQIVQRRARVRREWQRRPFRFGDQKTMGRDAFTKIPNGIPSIQERVDLVHTCGVTAGRLGLQAMVDACSTQAAKLFGLYPKKGTIQLGSDADLVVYDPGYRGTFSKECSYSQVDYNAYEGWEQKGRASAVTVRGKVQARDGEFVGTMGRGVFLKREPTH